MIRRALITAAMLGVFLQDGGPLVELDLSRARVLGAMIRTSARRTESVDGYRGGVMRSFWSVKARYQLLSLF